MKIINSKNLSLLKISQLLRKQRAQLVDVQDAVKKIIANVQSNGDKALREYANQFDGVQLTNLQVSAKEIKEAYQQVDQDLIGALKQAKANIEKFHKTTFKAKEPVVETVVGVKVWREFRPIEKVGLYVPGGKATYPSTVLMLAIPAKLAGCQEVVICTPCDKTGKCNAAVLVAADLCGVKKIFKVGGAQAIAAMAYGTETIPQVYKIFGPGNQYVTTAKMLLYGQVDIDMPAGPSELMIIADQSAKAAWVAADFLSQLEHGEDSQTVLLTTSLKLAEAVKKEVIKQMKNLSREKIIKQSLKNSVAIVCKDLFECVQLANEYAPEHLEVVVEKNEQALMKAINNVGSIFLGPYSSEPLGDYATGANHTLSTSGFAKMFSPLSCQSFGKMIQIQKVEKQGIKKLKKTVETLAFSEGLDAHANAVSIRFNN